MHPFFEDYLERLHELHSHILEALDGLPQEALDWTPMQDANSIAVLVVHLTGACRYWIGDVAMQESSGRVRAEEFQVRGLDVETLKKRLAETEAYARSALERLSLDRLASERSTDPSMPGEGKTFTIGWALLHALEHTALHVGHIQITRQLWDDRQQ